jgi:hypothetical protein
MRENPPLINRLLLVVQFWEGDKSRAMELAQFLADLEPVKCQIADFMFAARFDCRPHEPTVQHVARKFNVRTLISRRRGVGWPDGCNELWFSTMEWVQSMTQARKIPQYKAIFTFEADGAPIKQDWIASLSSEWDRVNTPNPVCIAGALVDPGPHINGNALISGRPKFLHWIARRVGGVRPGTGWDFVLARDFQRIGWADIPGVKSIYNTPTFTQEQYEDMVRQDWIWVHGGKDTSLIQMGRKRFSV